MNRFKLVTRPLGVCAFVVAAIFVPHIAQAQDVPSYARPADASADETIHGRIRSVDGAFTITVDDDRGFADAVQLHGGTIINPTGLSLSPGMSVTILGYNAGSVFDANEIDTPYSYDGPLPTPVYYGAGYWCPGFAYGYGPSFGLAIVFGGGGGPWHYEHRPYYGRPWNGYGYFGHAVSFAPDGRRIGGDHVPAAFEQRHFAGEQRFSSESNASAVHQSGGAAGGFRHTESSRFAQHEANGAHDFGAADGARAGDTRGNAGSGAARGYRGGEGRATGTHEPQAARGANNHPEGGHSQGAHATGGRSGEGRGR